MDNKKTIRDLIYKSYVRAALIPILLIEVTLLVMYFGITNYIEKSTEKTLLEEAKYNISEITTREGRNINLQMTQIATLAEMLQKDNQRLFENPEGFSLPNGNAEFAFAPNETYYKTNDNGGSSLWYSGVYPVGDKEKKKALVTEAMDSVFKLVFEANDNIVGLYFNSFDSMNRYYPYLPEVYNVFEKKMDIPRFNFYYLADQDNNPKKGVVWTEAYLDPAGKGWMASCIVPIYNGTFLEGVTGIDITIDRIVDNVLNLKLPWQASAFLVDHNGVILAMPERVETIFGIKELREAAYTGHILQDTSKPEAFNLLKNKNAEIANQIQTAFKQPNGVTRFSLNQNSYLLSQSVIENTGWKLFVLVEEDVIYAPAKALNVLSQKIGMIALGVMILFYALFFTYLLIKSKMMAERVATPIRRVAEKTTEIKENLIENANMSLEYGLNEGEQVEEIELLMSNFNTMASELSAFYNHLDEIVRKRTEELNKANEELNLANIKIMEHDKMVSVGQLAAGVAHEINNPMGFVISNIDMLRKYSEQLIQHIETVESFMHSMFENVPESIKEVMALRLQEVDRLKKEKNIGFILEEIFDVFDETAEGTLRVKSIVGELSNFSNIIAETEFWNLNQAIDNTLKMMSKEMDLKTNINRIYGEVPSIKWNKGLINQALMNVLRNAVQSIEGDGDVTIKTWTENEHVNIRISDTGKGIPEEIQPLVFNPFFTTKEVGSGTGLGLSVTYDIVSNHKGNIQLESKVGIGTTVTMTLPIDFE